MAAGEGRTAELDTGLPALRHVVGREELRALADAQQNVSRAARPLGISRDTLRYRMNKHGLKG